MLKRLNRSDKTLRPFHTFKNWVIDTTINEDIILTEDGKKITAYENTSSYGQYYGSGSLATQRQPYNYQQYPSEGLKIDGLFYDMNDPWYESGSNPVNWNNTYKRIIYSTIDGMFYKNASNPLYTFGVEKCDEGKNGEIETRVIHDRVNSINVVQQVFGNKIRPNTVNIQDYSDRDDVYIIKDDGYTNLKFQDVYFKNRYMIQPPVRSEGMTYLYDVSTERFGKRIATWGQYVLTGAPKDSTSLSDDKNGKAFLYRIDTGSNEYKYIREFETPFTQNGFAREQTWDYSDLLMTELGFFLLPEGESTTLDGYSEAITINDNFLAIGSPYASYKGSETGSSGQVFVHDKYKGGFDHWGLINILEGSSSGDNFGSAVHLSGSKLAVGADGAYGSRGAVYIFQQYVYGQNIPTSSFWYRVDPMLVDDFNIYSELGDNVIYSEIDTPYFIEDDNVWILQHVITSSNWVSGSKFGGSVKLNNDRLLVGSKQHSTASAVYVFEYNPNAIGTGIYDTSSFYGPTGSAAFGTGSWVETFVLTNTGVHSGSSYYTHSVELDRQNYFFPSYVTTQQIDKDGFGTAVDMRDNYLVIGSPFDRVFTEYSGSPVQYGAGAAYFFHYTQSNWECIDKVYGREDDTVNNLFGIDVSMNRDRIAIGSPLSPYTVLNYWNTSSQEFQFYQLTEGAFNASSYNFYTGETFLYKFDSEASWSYEKCVRRVKYNGEPKSLYGSGVGLNEDYLIVGNPVVSYTNTTNLDSKFIRESVPHIITGSTFLYELSDLNDVYQVGNVFYKNGLLTNTLTSSLFKDIFQGNVKYRNDLFGYSMSFQGTHKIHENEVMCTIQPGEFNVSTNPTSLKNDPVLYDIEGDGFFSLFDVQLLVNYITKNYRGLISGSLMPPEVPTNYAIQSQPSASWWKDDLILLESEDVLLLESWVAEPIPSASYTSYYETIKKLDEAGYLDVNLDGKVDIKDAYLILRYYLGYGGTKLTKDAVNDRCQRRYENQIRDFLDKMTGKLNGRYIREEFLSYQESSSLDKTGSYLAPFVTQVGLYQDGLLVAVAKLGKPIKNSADYPITFNVKYDSF